MSEGEIEKPMLWRRLWNDIDEREGTGIISKSTARQGHRASSWASPEIESRTSKGALV